MNQQSVHANEAIVQKTYVHRPPSVDSFLVPSCVCVSVNVCSSWRSITTDDPGWPRDDSGVVVASVGKTGWSRRSSLELFFSYYGDPVSEFPLTYHSELIDGNPEKRLL